MRLDDLRAYETDSSILFDCPCRSGHRMRLLKANWQISGTFPQITVHPAIEIPCGKWNILDGEVLKS